MLFEFIDRGTEVVGVLQSLKYTGRWDWGRTCLNLGLSVLHVADEEVSWYHFCIPEVERLLRTHGVSRLVGHSMGGYGALLFGRMLGIKAVAFAPQTTLEASLDKRWSQRWVEIRRKTRHPEYLSLSGRFDAEIYYCRDVLLDVFHAKRVQSVFRPMDCETHEESVKNVDILKVFSPRKKRARPGG